MIMKKIVDGRVFQIIGDTSTIKFFPFGLNNNYVEIFLDSVVELDSDGDEIEYIDTFEGLDTSVIVSGCDDYQGINTTSVYFSLSKTLKSFDVEVDVEAIIFLENGNITMKNDTDIDTYPVTIGDFKFNFNVNNWGFESLDNYLKLTFSITGAQVPQTNDPLTYDIGEGVNVLLSSQFSYTNSSNISLTNPIIFTTSTVGKTTEIIISLFREPHSLLVSDISYDPLVYITKFTPNSSLANRILLMNLMLVIFV